MGERSGATTVAMRRARVAEMYLSGKDLGEIAAELGIFGLGR